jgi:hypothetical protein
MRAFDKLLKFHWDYRRPPTQTRSLQNNEVMVAELPKDAAPAMPGGGGMGGMGGMM